MRTEWRFFLAHSFQPGQPNIGELRQARGKRLELALNKAGALNFDIPISDPIQILTQPLITCVKAVRYSDAHPNGRVVWSGPVWTRTGSFNDNKLSINCVGWFQLLEYREIEVGTVTHTAQDAGVIAHALLTHANNHANGTGVPGSAPTPISVGTRENSQVRTRTYTRGQKIGPEIEALSSIESGFDFAVDPVTLEMNIYEKLMTDREEVVMGYNWGPKNLQDVEPNHDGSRTRNHLIAQGKNNAAGVQYDDDSIALYGKMAETAPLSDIGDPNILMAYAAAEVAALAQPLMLYGLKPFPNINHRLFEEYEIGDLVYFSARKEGWPDIDKQAVRIFGVTLSIDEENNEKTDSMTVSL